MLPKNSLHLLLFVGRKSEQVLTVEGAAQVAAVEVECLGPSRHELGERLDLIVRYGQPLA